MTRGYTDEDLLDALRAFAADHDGRPPTAPEANSHEDLPSATAFVWHFETWNAAVEAAGLEPRDRRRSDEELLDDLREFAESDGYPSYKTVAAREDIASRCRGATTRSSRGRSAVLRSRLARRTSMNSASSKKNRPQYEHTRLRKAEYAYAAPITKTSTRTT